MESSYITGFHRNAVCFFSFLVALGGIAIVGVGTWTAITIREFPNLLGEGNGIFIAVYLMIGVGAAMVIFSFFGCAAVCLSSKNLLVIYMFIIFFIFLAQMVGSVLPFVFFPIATDEAQSSINNYNDDNSTQQAWDRIQGVLQCCGVRNLDDWQVRPQFPTLPASCCSDRLVTCTGNSRTVYNQGCQETLQDFFYVLGGVGFGILLVELFCLCSSAYALRQLANL